MKTWTLILAAGLIAGAANAYAGCGSCCQEAKAQTTTAAAPAPEASGCCPAKMQTADAKPAAKAKACTQTASAQKSYPKRMAHQKGATLLAKL